MPRRPTRDWPDLAILLAAAALGVALVRWADADFLRVEPRATYVAPADSASGGPTWRTAWDYGMLRAYHDGVWALLAATAGVGAVVARRGGWRRRRVVRQPGALAVLTLVILGSATIAHGLLAMPPYVLKDGIRLALMNRIDVRLPGAAIGAWVVAWPARRRVADGPERLARAVAVLWVAGGAWLTVLGLLFG